MLIEWGIGLVDVEVVGPGIIVIGTSNETVVVNNDKSFIGDLRTGIFEDAVGIIIPWVVNIVIIQNTLIVSKEKGERITPVFGLTIIMAGMSSSPITAHS